MGPNVCPSMGTLKLKLVTPLLAECLRASLATFVAAASPPISLTMDEFSQHPAEAAITAARAAVDSVSSSVVPPGSPPPLSQDARDAHSSSSEQESDEEEEEEEKEEDKASVDLEAESDESSEEEEEDDDSAVVGSDDESEEDRAAKVAALEAKLCKEDLCEDCEVAQRRLELEVPLSPDGLELLVRVVREERQARELLRKTAAAEKERLEADAKLAALDAAVGVDEVMAAASGEDDSSSEDSDPEWVPERPPRLRRVAAEQGEEFRRKCTDLLNVNTEAPSEESSEEESKNKIKKGPKQKAASPQSQIRDLKKRGAPEWLILSIEADVAEASARRELAAQKKRAAYARKMAKAFGVVASVAPTEMCLMTHAQEHAEREAAKDSHPASAAVEIELTQA